MLNQRPKSTGDKHPYHLFATFLSHSLHPLGPEGVLWMLCLSAVPCSSQLFVILFSYISQLFFEFRSPVVYLFYSPERDNKNKPLCSKVIKALEGKMASFIFLQISRSESMPYVWGCGLRRCIEPTWGQGGLLHPPGNPAVKDLQEKNTVCNNSYTCLSKTSIS